MLASSCNNLLCSLDKAAPLLADGVLEFWRIQEFGQVLRGTHNSSMLLQSVSSPRPSPGILSHLAFALPSRCLHQCRKGEGKGNGWGGRFLKRWWWGGSVGSRQWVLVPFIYPLDLATCQPQPQLQVHVQFLEAMLRQAEMAIVKLALLL